ncbi:MAG TPA: cystathionine gamma-lyase [Pseudonocardiaceae bacterium]|nr:cystathionine gamma-lyase [Pseudonocardiaceae bacterium]
MWGDGTRCVQAGHVDSPAPGQPLAPGPVFAAPYHMAADGPGEVDFYGRNGNPTWRLLEAAIGELDGGRCVLFPSGMAAISTTLRTLLRPGDTVVLPSDGYYQVRQFAQAELVPTGIRVREVPTPGPWPDDVFDGAALVLLETPSNPGLDVCDVVELAARGRATGALVAVDNTTASPLGQRPLELGADLVVASDSKALTGHSDLVLGHVSVNPSDRSDLAERLVAARTRSGSVPGPFEAWLALRSLGTLDLRLARQAENARAVATALRAHPAVRGLRWPGLPEDPAFPVASAQMRRFGGVLRFELASAAAVAEFVGASRLVLNATSFGGLHTTADRRAQWGDGVSEGFVRLSLGCEDADDLVKDILAALDALP